MTKLKVKKDNFSLDFLSLGSLVHRLDPGRIPFRKARSVNIHVSGGEYNVAANLSDCFGLKTGIATAMVDYGIGELVQSRVKEMGVRPIYKWFMMGFFVNFFALGYVGMLPAEGLYLLIARVGLLYYFGFFFIITPFVGWIEKPSKLPLSISDVYAKNIAPNIGGGEKGIPSPAMQKDTNL